MDSDSNQAVIVAVLMFDRRCICGGCALRLKHRYGGERRDGRDVVGGAADRPRLPLGPEMPILSYNGGVQFGLVADGAIASDPHDIIRRFQPEFDKLVTLALMAEWD